MPTNDSHRERRTSGSGATLSMQSTSRERSASRDRTRSRHPENGNRSRTKFADRRRKRGRILIALAALCAIELVYALLSAPALNVKHTYIEGIASASELAKADVDLIRRAAAMPTGTNWILAPVGRIHSNLTALPWIRSATVRRRLPTDVVIAVEPRVPAYALITPGGKYEVAEDNMPIRPLRREMENRLTPIVLSTVGVPKPGVVFANTAECTAAQILHLTQSDTGQRIAKIEIDQSTNIWLNMSAGVRIKFGHCEDVDKKIAMMRKLLSHDRGKRFAEINLSNPDWPAGILREPANRSIRSEIAASNIRNTTGIHADRTASGGGVLHTH